MKRQSVLFVFLFIAVLSSCSVLSGGPKADKISSVDLHELNLSESVLIDCRTAEEVREKGYISGAIFIDSKSKNLNTKLQAYTDLDRPIYVYCASGGRSTRVSSRLINLGAENVYNVADGFNGWLSNGFEVEKAL